MAKKDFDNREDIDREEDKDKASPKPSALSTEIKNEPGDQFTHVKNASASGLGSLEKSDEEGFESEEDQFAASNSE